MDEVVSYLINRGTAWIRDQQAHYRHVSNLLPPQVVGRLVPFFTRSTLESIRVQVVPSIEDPPFYTELQEAGIKIPLDFSQMAGITLIDTVLISAAATIADPNILTSLLFHESVHVAQYRHLGVERFIAEYVTGWAQNGFDYFAIPLERHAYRLQSLFDEAPRDIFSVEASVLSCFP